MANWKQPNPKDTATDKERADFLREIWSRVKFFRITIPIGFAAPAGGVETIFVSRVGGGGDIETDQVLGLRQGMPVKLTYTSLGGTSPTAGLTWDCAVQSDDGLDIWFTNSSGAPIAVVDGEWSVMGVVL